MCAVLVSGSCVAVGVWGEGVCVVRMYVQFTFSPSLLLPPFLTPPVFPPLKERLGEARDQPREQAQLLIQQILKEVVSSPQAFLDRLLDATLTHKNWRVKEQGLVCLARTLN